MKIFKLLFIINYLFLFTTYSQITILDDKSPFLPMTEFKNKIFGFNKSGFVVIDGILEKTTILKPNLKSIANYNRTKGNHWAVLNDKLYFSAEGAEGEELWVTDGTPIGTYLLKDILPQNGSTGIQYGYPRYFKIYNNKLYFSGRAGRDFKHTEQLWVSDGTEEGTEILKILPYDEDSGYYSYPEPSKFNVINGKLTFQSNYNELWVSDGTEKGTVKIKQFGTYESIRGEIMSINDKIIFQISKKTTAEPEQFLWISDGTEEGTKILKEINEEYFLSDDDSYTNQHQTSKNYILYNNKIYFLTSHNFWVTDGTELGTYIIKHYKPKEFGNSYFTLGRFKGGIFFSNPETDTYWRSDGTIEGTINTNILSGDTYSGYRNLRVVNGMLMFNKYENSIASLWSSDGTLDGTQKVYELDDEYEFWGDSMFSYNDELYFSIINYDNHNTRSEFLKFKNTNNNSKDQDNDGVTNDIDLCANTPTGEAVNADGCSQSELDDDNDKVFNNKDLCTNTPAGEEVNIDGCAQSQLDDDNDGVTNDKDTCPDTPLNINVDNVGCPTVFQLPTDNFTIKSIGETCMGKKNGQLSIIATESHNYIASVNGNDFSFTTSITIDNLTPTVYQVCISIPEYPEYKQCYSLQVQSAIPITGKSTTIQNNNKSIEMVEITSGTPPYKITVNNLEVLKTDASVFSVDIIAGDIIKVASKYTCEGVYEKQIRKGRIEEIVIYPNPTKEKVSIVMPNITMKTIAIKIYDIKQQLVLSNLYPIKDNKLEMSLKQIPNGLYFIKIETETPTFLKIIKQ